MVDDLIDAVPSDGPWDLVASVASPLPIAVITDLLGVPDDDSAAFARYGATIGSALAGPQSIAHVARLIEADRQRSGCCRRCSTTIAKNPATTS